VVFVLLVYFFLKTADLKTIKSAPIISNEQKDRRIPMNRRLNSLSIILGVLILSATGGIANWYNPSPIYLENNLDDIPLVIGGWKGFDVKKLNNRIDNVSSRDDIKLPDSVLKRIYNDNFGNTIKVYVGYYAIQAQNKEIVSYQYDWLHDNALPFKIIGKSDGDIQINKTRYRYNNNVFNAYFWYLVKEKSFANRYKAKLYTITNTFFNLRKNGAIVVIELGKNSGAQAAEFNNRVIEFIKQFMLNLKEITEHVKKS
jgi:EpsI family protein